MAQPGLACARVGAIFRRVDANLPLLPPGLAAEKGGPVLFAVLVRGREPRATPVHAHERGQVLGALSGLLTVDTEAGRWLVGPEEAVWTPPHRFHGLRSHGAFAGWSLYIAPAACAALPAEPCVLQTTPLLRALAERAATWPRNSVLDPAQERLALLAVDEVARLRREPVALPAPSDTRLRRIAAVLAANPADGRDLRAWAALAGLSTRTLSRRFAADTGMSFSAWRTRARLLSARERLARGDPVTAVAVDVGYDSPSAFAAAFRRAFGRAPRDHAAGAG